MAENNDEKFMIKAIEQTRVAFDLDEIPVGCVIVKNGEIIAWACNSIETNNSATVHAELKAINQATQVIGNFGLDNCTMHVTLEPCMMCTGALVYSRAPKVMFGAFDKKRGACGSLLLLNGYEGLNHKVEVESIMEKGCVELIQSFFRRIREKNRNK